MLAYLRDAYADLVLPTLRDWIDTNSWIVNEIVIGFFLMMTISGL